MSLSVVASALPTASPIPSEFDGLPLAPIERFLLRNDAPSHPVVFRVLLRFDGPVQAEKLSAAFQLAIARQPLLTSLVEGQERQAVWRLTSQIPELRWQPPGLSPEEVAQVPIAYLNLSETPGIHCRVWPISDGISDGIMVLLDIHHVCCDGQGARQFLAEWFGLYQQLLKSESPQLASLAYAQLKDRAHYRTMKPPIGTWEGLRNLYLTVRGRTVRLPERFQQIPATDFLCERTLSIEETTKLRQGLKRREFSINDIGLAASFSTFVELYPQETRRGYITLMHPVDLRWPSDLRTPACNRVGVTFLRLKKNACLDARQLLLKMRDEMRYIKQRYVGAEFLRGLASADGLPGGTDRIQSWGWFIPTLQFTCLGDTTRALHYRFNQVDGVINFGGLKLERISGFMQLGPFLPISLAACETNQKLSLTARASARHFDQESAQRFSEGLRRKDGRVRNSIVSVPLDAAGVPLTQTSRLEVWLLQDDLVSDLDLGWLSEEERRRGDRYRSPSKCRQFLFSRCIGREIFAARLGVVPAEIRWSTSGRPHVNVAGRPAEISVSISHSGPIVAVAMSPQSVRIGVDIEISTPLQVAALSAVALTDTEREALRQVPNETREAVMRQLWTIKEAVLKSLGTSELPELQSVQVNWNVAQPDWLAALEASQIQLQADHLNSRFAIGCFHSILEPEGAIWGTISVCDDSKTAVSHSHPCVCLRPTTESLPENIRNDPWWNTKNGVLHSRLEAKI